MAKRGSGFRLLLADPNDFDSVAWCYDLTPVPTHAKRLAPRLRGVSGVVLDVGGGTGKYTARIVDPARHRVLILDPARKMLRKAVRRGRPVAALQGVGHAIPLPGGSVAAIVMTEAFHHFAPHQERVIQEAARVLTPGGLIVIEEPDPTRRIGRVFEWLEHRQGMDSRFLAPGDLAAMLAPWFDALKQERTGWFTYVTEARRRA